MRFTVRFGSWTGAVLALAVGTVVSTAPPASAASDAVQPKPGLIAVEGPMTGEQAATGIDMARGAELAVNQINAAGGVNGVKLTMIKVDDAATATKGVKAARKAIAAGAFGVVGPFNSSVGIANLPLYKRAGLPIVRLTSSVKTEGLGVTTQPMDSQVAPVDIREITQVIAAKHPAIIYDTSTYTSGIAKQVATGLKKAGHPAVATVSVKTGQTNYSAALRKLARAQPDLLYIAAYGTEAGQIAKAASTVSLGTCFVDLAAQGPDFVTAATQAVAEHCFSSGVPSAEQFTGASQYVTDYNATYHSPPGTWGPYTYDSVEILAAAIKQSGWNQKAVASSLRKISNYQGITGPITIAPASGNRVQSTVVILDVDPSGSYVIDPTWANAVGFPLTATP
jgi:branched-chain amino acid transport system substrate-binding protein